jgi:hypothetical protein
MNVLNMQMNVQNNKKLVNFPDIIIIYLVTLHMYILTSYNIIIFILCTILIKVFKIL